jgi:DNA-binding GntR family transcriptional regulator
MTTRETPTEEPERSSADRVVDAIGKGILMRRYAVGQRLVEADLTRHLGVSRSSVREALKILATRGVIELTPHRGAVIRPLSRGEAAQLLLVLEVLCGLAARLATLHIDRPGNRRKLEVVARTLAGTGGSPALLDERPHLHQALLDIADCPELARVMPLPRIQLFRTQFHDHLSRAGMAEMQREYAGVIEAIVACDAARAERRMRAHIVCTGERVQALTDAAFGPD